MMYYNKTHKIVKISLHNYKVPKLFKKIQEQKFKIKTTLEIEFYFGSLKG